MGNRGGLAAYAVCVFCLRGGVACAGKTMFLITLEKKCVSLLRVFYSYAANCVTNPYERVVRIEIAVETVTQI